MSTRLDSATNRKARRIASLSLATPYRCRMTAMAARSASSSRMVVSFLMQEVYHIGIRHARDQATHASPPGSRPSGLRRAKAPFCQVVTGMAQSQPQSQPMLAPGRCAYVNLTPLGCPRQAMCGPTADRTTLRVSSHPQPLRFAAYPCILIVIKELLILRKLALGLVDGEHSTGESADRIYELRPYE